MKKIMIMLAVVAAAVVANAASFNWQAANIYGSDMTTKYSGSVELYAVIDGVDTLVSTATANAGAILKANTGFESDKFAVGEYYDFYFVFEDAGKTFTSAMKADVLAQLSSTVTVNFGNMQSQTQNAANWSSADVPEPTSGLLLLLGVAGLALRRKQK
ncbi:MAG: PEP-CTERM sorting domain-containing protein [Kiritimatiellae bacterium]|nr:PEP-CTERM sorting domain-containing protein [Kiritimatiellia bacterium]